MTQRKKIAGAEEVLEALTAIVRSAEDTGFKPTERLKAVELLGKHYGLFEAAEAESGVNAAAVAALDALVSALRGSA